MGHPPFMDDLPIEMPTSGALSHWPCGKLPSWVPGAGWVYHESNPLQFIYVVQRSMTMTTPTVKFAGIGTSLEPTKLGILYEETHG